MGIPTCKRIVTLSPQPLAFPCESDSNDWFPKRQTWTGRPWRIARRCLGASLKARQGAEAQANITPLSDFNQTFILCKLLDNERQ